jgi:hypothetical protein
MSEILKIILTMSIIIVGYIQASRVREGSGPLTARQPYAIHLESIRGAQASPKGNDVARMDAKR